MPQENTQNSIGISLIDNLTKLTGAAAAILLVLSAAFDFSYLYALGISFEEVPTTVADHVRSALVWAPKAALYTLGFALYEMIMQRVEGGRTEEEIVQQSRNPRFIKWFRTSPRYGFAVVIVIAIAADTLINNSDRGLYFATLVTWGTLSIWIINHPRLGGNFSNTGRRIFVLLPMIGIWVSFLGYNQARSTLEEKSPRWITTIKIGESTTIQPLLGIRQFSTSAVIISVDRTVSIIPNEAIQTTSSTQPAIQSKSRLCSWFNVRCNTQTTN